MLYISQIKSMKVTGIRDGLWLSRTLGRILLALHSGQGKGKGRTWGCLCPAALLQLPQQHCDVPRATELVVTIKDKQTTFLRSVE